MIPNFVNPGTQYAQEKLYQFQSSFLVDESKASRFEYASEKRAACTTDQYVIVNRLLAVPIVAIDIALEALRPLCKAVESAAFVLVSLGAVFYHLFQLDLGEVKSDLRIMLYNFNDALKNVILTLFQAAVIPLLAVGQLVVTIAEPLASRPSHRNFPSDVNAYAWPHLPPHDPADKIEVIEAAQYGLYSELHKISHKSLATGRVVGVIAAITDSVIEVGYPLVKTIKAVAKGIFLLILAPIGAAIGSPQRAQENFEYSIALLNTGANSLAFTVSKIVLFPLKLVVQLAVTVYDPKNAMPSPRGLYRPRAGDRMLMIDGIHEEPRRNLQSLNSSTGTREVDPWFGT